MLRLMMNALLIASAVIASVAPAAPACTSYTFRTNPKLDLADVKRLAREPIASGARSTAHGGAELVVLPFDVEDHPIVGPWRALAIVYVTRGDLAERTVGGILLQTRREQPVELTAAMLRKDDAGVELSLPRSSRCPAYVIQLRNNGELVVQGASAGRLR